MLKDNSKVVLYEPMYWGPERPCERAPLGLLAISSLLDREGYGISIVSKMLYDEPETKLLEDCRNAICLGITTLTGYQIADGLRIARMVRQEYPSLPIVWGGWHPTLEPETTLKSPYADIVVRGQAERIFAELVHALEGGQPLEDIPGLSYKKDGQALHNPNRPLEDINNFPPMPYHLIDVEKVLARNDEFGTRVMNYISSYGCLYKCAFCAEWGVHDRKWSGLSAHRMADDFERLVKDYNVDFISVNDTQFCLYKDRVRELCEELIKRKLNLKWGGVNGNVRQLLKWEDEMWELLVKSGCRSMPVGAESGFPEALRFMNKALTREETLRFVKKAEKYDMKILVSLMMGLPWDPDYTKTRKLIDEEIRLNMDLADKIISLSNKQRISLAIFTPYPGTPMYQKALELGLKPPQNFEDWGNWISGKRITPWISPQQVKRINFITGYIFLLLDADAYNWVPTRIHNRVARLLFKMVYKVFIKIAKLRWRFKFFTLPLDYWIFRLARRMLGIV